MIRFKKLRFKNLLSTGNIWSEIDLDDTKTTLIVGENGVGKSQLLDAICLALFNRPFRKINKPGIVNSINKKDCLVELMFETNGQNYLIRRGLKPVVFEIFQNDKLINQDASSRDYQSFLEKTILKTTFKSFTQIVILGAATFTPFMKLTPADRRLVLDDLLDIQIFSSMAVLAKQHMVEIKNQLDNIEHSLKNENDKIEYIKKQISELKTNSDDHKSKIIDEIEKNTNNSVILEKNINELRKSIILLQSNITNENIFSEKMKTLFSLHAQIQAKSRRLVNQIQFFEGNDICNTCQQDIDNDFKNDIINKNKNELEEVNKGMDQISEKISDLRKIIDNIQEIKNQIISKENDIIQKQTRLDHIHDYIEKLKLDIDNLKNSGTTSILDTNIDELKKSKMNYEEFIENKKKLLDKKETVDFSLQLLKDGGIKTQIIRQYIPIINQTINRYLNAMDFMVNFVLDENFNEKVLSRYRDDFTYENFSEGQKSRIDLALLLTWRLIAKMRNSVNTNLLIMDEIFDSSLDTAGTDELVNILKDVVKDCNVFVISHRENMRELFDKTLVVKMHNNFSVIGE